MLETKKQIIERCARPLGYWSALGGVEVFCIEHGIDVYVYCQSNCLHGKRADHKIKVETTAAGDFFIRLYGVRLYMSECIRNDV